MSINETTISKHLQRATIYFPDKELCEIITQGVSSKPEAEVTETDVRGGLREANWSRNILKFAIKNSSQELKILNLYLDRIQELSKQEPKFFTWRCDYKGNPIWVRLVTHLVCEMELPEYTEKLSLPAKQRILDVAQLYESSVDARIRKTKKIKANFDTVFPELEYPEVRDLLLSEDGEISPKKCGKLLLEVKEEEKKNKLLTQYFDAVMKHPKNALAKKLVQKFQSRLKKYTKTYKAELAPEIRQMCEARISEFNKIA